MQPTETTPETLAGDLARECLYRFLAGALADPGSEGWRLVQDPESQRLACTAADLLRADASPAVPLGIGELPPEQLDLRPLLADLLKPTAGLRETYDRVFGLVPAPECPPYEIEYHPAGETFFRAQQLADVAGFYRAFGIGPAVPERPDYLPLELEFMAFLLMKKRLAAGNGETEAAEQSAVCDQALRSFFADHLAWWVPAFATGLQRKAGSGLYAALGEVLAALVPLERYRFGLPAARVPLQATLIERPEEQAGCTGCALQG
jgi:TorA maturation chaperone TorD